MVADLVEQFHDAGRRKDHRRQAALGWRLLASGDAHAFDEWLLRNPPLSQSLTGPDGRMVADDSFVGELLGFSLRGGAGVPISSPNPWGLTGSLDVNTAIRRIWRPVAADAPEFIEALVRNVFGLALVAYSGRLCLAYLHYQGDPPDGHDDCSAATIAELAGVEHGSIETLGRSTTQRGVH